MKCPLCSGELGPDDARNMLRDDREAAYAALDLRSRVGPFRVRESESDGGTTISVHFERLEMPDEEKGRPTR